MPKPIRSILAAAGLLAVAALAAAGLMVAAGPAHADCTISGPTTAGANQSFSPNYGLGQTRQLPRSARLWVRYSF